MKRKNQVRHYLRKIVLSNRKTTSDKQDEDSISRIEVLGIQQVIFFCSRLYSFCVTCCLQEYEAQLEASMNRKRLRLVMEESTVDGTPGHLVILEYWHVDPAKIKKVCYSRFVWNACEVQQSGTENILHSPKNQRWCDQQIWRPTNICDQQIYELYFRNNIKSLSFQTTESFKTT